MDNLAKLMELLQGMSIDKLRLVLHFAEYLKKQQDKEKTGQG